MADGEAAQVTPKIIDDLIRGARDRNTCELRQACIQTLITSVDREKGPEPKVTDILIERTSVTGEPSKQVRMQAIIALGAVGRPHSPAKLKQVLKALHDHYYSTDKSIRIWTHVSLMALNEEIKQKDVNMIVDCLDPQKNDREVRKQAVLALGAMAKKTTEHVKDICALLKDEKETMVQEAACRALARMGDKSDRVVSALIRLTEKDTKKTNEVVMAACATLAQLHVDDTEVIDALKAVQKHELLGDPEKKMVEQYVKIIQSPPPADVKGKDKRELKDGNKEKDKKRGGR
jgi:HEAT repeat protein